MDDLVQWLRAQLDEDERIAREAKPGPWHAEGGSVYATHPTDEVVDYSESADHIAEWDPARVLRELDAKRRLLVVHRPYAPEPDQSCLGCAGGITFTSCPVVRLLALPYADRPGYREEWRP